MNDSGSAAGLVKHKEARNRGGPDGMFRAAPDVPAGKVGAPLEPARARTGALQVSARALAHRRDASAGWVDEVGQSAAVVGASAGVVGVSVDMIHDHHDVVGDHEDVIQATRW